MLVVTPQIQIPLAEFQFTFSRSSGPGGQNVNKVNSKALLRWPIKASPSLSDDVRERLLARYGNRVTDEGDLLIVSQRYRDQAKNVDDCLEKLRELLASVAKAPVKRRPTKPSRAAKERRLTAKRHTTARKESRRVARDE